MVSASAQAHSRISAEWEIDALLHVITLRKPGVPWLKRAKLTGRPARLAICLAVVLAAICRPAAAQNWSGHMMDGSGMGGFMWGMGLFWLLLLVLAVLGVIALVKYLFRG